MIREALPVYIPAEQVWNKFLRPFFHAESRMLSGAPTEKQPTSVAGAGQGRACAMKDIREKWYQLTGCGHR